MKEQPEALRLADVLDSNWCAGESPQEMTEAAAELRRLHAQRAEMLEALRTLLSYAFTLEMRLDADGEHRAMQKARAAIKAVEEGENHAKNL